MTHNISNNYSPIIKKLIALGEKNTDWIDPGFDYQEIGITKEHIPELIDIIRQINKFWPEEESDSDEVFAPIHAWRALGQLRAEEGIQALVELIVQNEELESDWIMEEIPKVMGMIGPESIPALQAYLQNPQKKVWASATMSQCLEEVGKQNPESRPACVQALQIGLEDYAVNDFTTNTFLITSLASLKAVEAVSLVERAYRADRVDLSVMGDFEDYQMAVGILEKRLTPPPRYDHYDDPQAQWEADKRTRREEERRKRQQAKKAKKKRQQAKKARRRKKRKRG
jgi:hypothetical protein